MNRAVLRRGPLGFLRFAPPVVSGAFVTVVADVAGPVVPGAPSSAAALGIVNASADATCWGGGGFFSFCGGARRQSVLASSKSAAPILSSVFCAMNALFEYRSTCVRYLNRGRVVGFLSRVANELVKSER